MDNDAYHDVCCFYLSQIGENVNNVSPKLTEEYPEVSWVGLRELRNTVAHGYEGMDFEAAWTTITKKIPKIKKICEKMLKELKKWQISSLLSLRVLTHRNSTDEVIIFLIAMAT